MRVIYSKYNRERLPKFQIETSICKEGERIFVRKRALSADAQEHIRALYQNYVLMKTNWDKTKIVNCHLEKDDIIFEYVNGQTLDLKLIEAVLNKDEKGFFRLLTRYRDFVYSLGSVKVDKYKSNSEFKDVFGSDFEQDSVDCLQIANIDLNFDNIILLDGHSKFIIIDYEWVFKFPIPVKYIFYRSILIFITKYNEYLKYFLDINKIYQFFGIDSDLTIRFKTMEQGFQNFVFGSNHKYKIGNQYSKKNQKLYDVEKLIVQQNTQIEELKANIQNLRLELHSKELELLKQEEELGRKDQELKNKDKEIEQKEVIIQNLNGHIEQLLNKERTLNNILNSRGWKLLKKLYRLEDRIIPPKSKRRLFGKILFIILKNPKQILSSITLHKLKQFYVYLRTEDNEVLDRKWATFLDVYGIKEVQLPKRYVPKYTGKRLVFKKEEQPLVSIIIPVYNQWNYTYSCLQSILENTPNIPYEIIVADDVSTDETVNIQEYVENITVIRNEVNKGFLFNCNNAAQYAKGKYILFLNNDTSVQKEWLKYLVDLIEKDDTIGMVGSKLIYLNGRLQEAGGIIWKDASGWNYGRLDDPEKPEYNYVKEVDYISGACIMIKADLWKEIGGFDERFAPAYFEDTDLAFEVRKRGYKVVLQPKSVVVHFEGVSHGTDTDSGIKSYQVINRDKFVEKWKDVLESEHFENGKDVFWARDKSKNKKTILVIDHYVPHYDKDAGSRTTYQYLKLFVEMGLNVKFLGDNFFRHEPYTSVLEQMGIEVLHGSWYRDNYQKWIKENSNKIDYVYLNRPHISIKYIDFIKKYTNANVLYYGHDLHYIRELKRYEIEKKVECLEFSKYWKTIEFNIFNKSDVILTISDSERDIIQKSFPDKPVVVFPVFYYEQFNRNFPDFTLRNNIMFVGGFSHIPNIDAVLWFTQKVFPKVLQELPDLKFYIVGSNPPTEILNLKSSNVIVKGFVTDEELNELYAQVKLIVIPLRYGAGVKGKTIEAMYYGVPIVTTDFGIEGLPGINQIISAKNDEDSFAREIIELYKNEAKLANISRQYLSYVKQNFSKEKAIDKINYCLRVKK